MPFGQGYFCGFRVSNKELIKKKKVIKGYEIFGLLITFYNLFRFRCYSLLDHRWQGNITLPKGHQCY